MEKHVFEYVQRGRKFVVEVGELAKQANGAVLVRYDDTAVLSSAVCSNQVMATDFFPLTVLYQEKLYAGGKIPGGFLKRESRPTEHETLVSRLIDRPIRPLFPKGYRNDIQIVAQLFSYDQENQPDTLAMLGKNPRMVITDSQAFGEVSKIVPKEVPLSSFSILMARHKGELFHQLS